MQTCRCYAQLASLRPMLLKMAQLYLRNKAWAEDAVHDALLAVLEHLDVALLLEASDRARATIMMNDCALTAWRRSVPPPRSRASASLRSRTRWRRWTG